MKNTSINEYLAAAAAICWFGAALHADPPTTTLAPVTAATPLNGVSGVTVSSGTTVALARLGAVSTYSVAVGSGTAAYTAAFELPAAGSYHAGDYADFSVSWPASANPLLLFVDPSTSETLRAEAGTATSGTDLYFFVATSGSSWASVPKDSVLARKLGVNVLAAIENPLNSGSGLVTGSAAAAMIASGSAGVSGSSVASGSAGVSGSSVVSGSAGVSGSSVVSGSAGVSGSSVVSGSAGVSGSSVVSGSAGVSGSSVVSGSAGVTGTAYGMKVGPGVFQLVIGTSISRYGSVGYQTEESTCDYLSWMLSGSAGTAFVGCSGTNIGVPATQLSYWLTNYTSLVHPFTTAVTGKPTDAWVELGANDMVSQAANTSDSPQTFVSGTGSNTLETFCAKLRADGCSVGLCTIRPEGGYWRSNPVTPSQYNVDWFRRMCNYLILTSTVPNCVVDVASWFPNPLDGNMYTDQVHPTTWQDYMWALNLGKMMTGQPIPTPIADSDAYPVMNTLSYQSANAANITDGNLAASNVQVTGQLQNYSDAYLMTSTSVTLDSGTGGNNLTNHSVVTSGSVGAYFNGSAWLTSGTTFFYTGNAFAISGSFYTTSSNSYQYIADDQDYETINPLLVGFGVYINNSNQLLARSGGGCTTTAAATVSSGTWTQFAACYDPSNFTVTLWKDFAAPVVNTNNSNAVGPGGVFYQTSTQPFIVGAASQFHGVGLWPFTGTIAGLRIWNNRRLFDQDVRGILTPAGWTGGLFSGGGPGGGLYVTGPAIIGGTLALTGTAAPPVTTGTPAYWINGTLISGTTSFAGKFPFYQ